MTDGGARCSERRTDRDSAFFLEELSIGRLAVQTCNDCGTLRHPPAPVCPACRSFAWRIAPLSGRGTIYSYAVHHYPPTPGMTVPYVIALVALEEGVRMVGNLVGTDMSQIMGEAGEGLIGQAVALSLTPDEAGGPPFANWRLVGAEGR